MKRIIVTITATIISLYAYAQNISVSSFKAAPDDFTAAAKETRRIDHMGNACALVKIATSQNGFSFDAGMASIVDVLYVESGIWLYLPAGTRYITISHKVYGTLSRWDFPVSLESARVYEMTLKTEMPKVPKPVKLKPYFDVDGFSSHFLQSHIGMEIYEGVVYGAMIGMNYSFIPKRMGFYTSVDYGVESETFSIFAGPAIRMLDSSSSTDWQLYAGLGYAGGSFGVDIGTKFGWKSDNVLSLKDFAVGCQYWGGGTIAPYVGLGAGITGYTALCVLGLIVCALGSSL